MEYAYFRLLAGQMWYGTPRILLFTAILLGSQIAIAQTTKATPVIALPNSAALQLPGASAATSEVFLPGIDSALVTRIRNRQLLPSSIPFQTTAKVLATPALPPHRYGSVLQVPGAAQIPEAASGKAAENDPSVTTGTTGSVKARPSTDLTRPATERTVAVKGSNLIPPQKVKKPAQVAGSVRDVKNGEVRGLSRPLTPITGEVWLRVWDGKVLSPGSALTKGRGRQKSGSAVNRPPVAFPDVYTTPRNEPLVVAAPGHLANDTDPEGDEVRWSSYSIPNNGTVSGTVSEGGFTYTPAAGFSGIDTIRVSITDGQGNSATGLLLILVENDYGPRAIPDVYTTQQGEPLVVVAPGHLANDTDPEGDELSWISYTLPENGNLSGTVPEGGFTYTPNVGFSGTESITVSITDGQGNIATGLLLIYVEENYPPQAVPDVYTTPQGTPLVVAAPGHLANDVDPEGDELSWISYTLPENGNFSGTVPEGGFTYTPDAGFSGVESIQVSITDGKGNVATGPLSIYVVANEAPQAYPDAYETKMGVPLVVSAPGHLANDTDPEGDQLSWISYTLPENGSVSGTVSEGGFTYTPNAGFSGTESITVSITDGQGNIANGLLTITVMPADGNVLVAIPDLYTTPKGTPFVVSAPGHLANDINPGGGGLSWISYTLPENGVISATGSDGTFTYTPDAGFAGTESITVTITDGQGNFATGQLVIFVEENYAPNAAPDVYTTPWGEPLVVDAPGHLANDTDPEGDELSWISYTLPGNGAVSGSVPEGAFTYTPNAGFSGAETIVYSITDGRGNVSFGQLIIYVEANYAPRAAPDVFTTPRGEPLVVTAPGHLSNDTDPEGDELSWISYTLPENGAVGGSVPEGAFTYTPDAGFTGIETIVYTITDGQGNVATGQLIIYVEDNYAPQAVPDVYTTPAGTPLVVTAPGHLANDTDPEGDELSWISYTLPENGNFSGTVTEGGFNYTPDAGFSGIETVSVTISDGNGNVATGLLTILVLESTPPVADAGADQTAIVGLPVVLDGSGSFDPDGDPITYNWVFATADASAPIPAGSAAILSEATTVGPTLIADLPGQYTIQLTVDDGVTDSAPDYVTIKAISINEALDLLSADLTALAGAGLNRWLQIAIRIKFALVKHFLRWGKPTQALQLLNLLRHQILVWQSRGVLTPAQAADLLRQLEMIEAAIEMQQPMRTYGAPYEEVAIDRAPEVTGITSISPNPFNASTRIVFDLPAAATVDIRAYNPLGQAVQILNHAYREAGRHEVTFAAAGLTGGTYTIRLTTDNGFAETRRVVLIR
ncbi:MAG: Ig-like domain-containing protein [Lewinella sp.]